MCVGGGGASGGVGGWACLRCSGCTLNVSDALFDNTVSSAILGKEECAQ